MIKKGFYILLLVACNTNNSLDKQTETIKTVSANNKHDSFPKIGKPMPDFTLNNILYYEKEQASLKDFKGKWIVLDFWNRLCVNCIKSFPKVNDLRKEFKGKVEFFLVGRNDGKYYSGSEKVYQKVRDKYNLELPLVYDAGLFDRFGVASVPHVILIDDKGMVRAITYDLNTENLKAFLAGKTPHVFHSLNKTEVMQKQQAYDYKKPLLIDGNGGKSDDFLFRSLLTGKNNTIYGSIYPEFFYPNMSYDDPGINAINISLKNLYKIAYGDTIRLHPDIYNCKNNYGKWWYTPILEVKDSTPFKFNSETNKGIYCYELIVPKNKLGDTRYRQRIMQRDLKSYFGHEVTVETRIMPYWKVKVVDEARSKLMTKGGEQVRTGDATKIVLRNQPMELLISGMWGLHQMDPPFIDETGIEGNIDITLEGILTDFVEFKKLLKEKGLVLEKGQKKMKVIVVRDPTED